MICPDATLKIYLDAAPEERARGRFGVEREKLQLPAQPAVVPQPRLLQPLEVRAELLLGVERGPVDPL